MNLLLSRLLREISQHNYPIGNSLAPEADERVYVQGRRISITDQNSHEQGTQNAYFVGVSTFVFMLFSWLMFITKMAIFNLEPILQNFHVCEKP